ncbi:MAG: class B sortase [Christensenella sp.]
MKKKRMIVLIMLYVIAAACGIFFIHEYCAVQKEEAEYTQIQEEYVKPKTMELSDSVPDIQDKLAALPYMGVDFGGLLRVNPNTVGWISIPDTPINYPVVQTVDNETYLSKSFAGENSKAGAVFMDKGNSQNPLDKNTILYGHNMGSGRQEMFGSLLSYKDVEYLKEHPYIQFDTISNNYGYWQIFAVLGLDVLSEDFDYLKLGFADHDDFTAWVKTAQDLSLYDTEIEVFPKDKVLTLSTCDRSKYGADGRLVVMALQRQKDKK